MSRGKTRLTTTGRKQQAARALMLPRLMAKGSSTEILLNIDQTLPLQLHRKQIPTAEAEDTSITSHSLKGMQGGTEKQHKTGLDPATMVVVVRG